MKPSIKIYLVVFSVLIWASGAPIWADDEHTHGKKPVASKTETKKQNEKAHVHEHNGAEKQNPPKESEKDHHDEAEQDHDHGEEQHKEGGEKNVGPDKGVTSFDEEKGFTLSQEAKKTFALQTQLLKGAGPWTLPTSALLLTGEEINIYRVRDSAFKKINVKIIKKTQGQVQIKSTKLSNGDAVVTQGVGFIRIAEADVTSGESGHHH
jgi:hypothetical protein